MTVLLDNQYQTPGGLVIGAKTAYRVVHFTGPGRRVRDADSDRPDGAGVFFGEEWPDANPWILDTRIIGSSPSDALAKYETLAGNWSTRGTEGFLGSSALIFKRPGQVQRRTSPGRPRIVEPDLSTARLKYIDLTLTYGAELPYEFSDVEHTTDLVINTVTPAANVTLANAGNFAAPVAWEIYGQVTDPGVIRSEADRFDLDTAIGDLDHYTIRTEAKTVTRASDGHSLYQTWIEETSTWLEIPAGGALFRAVGTAPTTAAVKARAIWRDTWW